MILHYTYSNGLQIPTDSLSYQLNTNIHKWGVDGSSASSRDCEWLPLFSNNNGTWMTIYVKVATQFFKFGLVMSMPMIPLQLSSSSLPQNSPQNTMQWSSIMMLGWCQTQQTWAQQPWPWPNYSISSYILVFSIASSLFQRIQSFTVQFHICHRQNVNQKQRRSSIQSGRIPLSSAPLRASHHQGREFP